MSSTSAATCIMGVWALERAAFRALLSGVAGLAPVTEAEPTALSVWEALREQPRLVIALVDRWRAEWRAALGLVRRLSPDTRLLLVVPVADNGNCTDWNALDAHAWLPKTATADDLAAAVRTQLDGQPPPRSTPAELATTPRRELDALSPRELELLPLLASGITLREAAEHMSISYKTADSYRTNLMRKLGVRNRVARSRLASRPQLIDA